MCVHMFMYYYVHRQETFENFWFNFFLAALVNYHLVPNQIKSEVAPAWVETALTLQRMLTYISIYVYRIYTYVYTHITIYMHIHLFSFAINFWHHIQVIRS